MTQPAAPKPKSFLRRLADVWRETADTASRLAGLGFVAVLVTAAGAVLIAMPAGLDLVTTVEDEGLRSPWMATLCIAIAYFGLQAWFWSRVSVIWNYGGDRSRWTPRWLLVWAPRVVGVAPLVLLLWAMWIAPAADKTASIAIVAVAALLLGFLIKREDVTRALIARSPRLTRLHRADPAAFRRHWMILSVVVSAASWIGVTFWPVSVSQALGPTATVYLALSGMVPIVVLLLHWGRRLRLPIAGALVVLAALFTLEPWTWADNHLIGRRAPFARMSAGIEGKVDLAPEYAAWTAQAPRAGGVQPLIFVASEGGASRAAYWTAAVLAGLRTAPAASSPRACSRSRRSRAEALARSASSRRSPGGRPPAMSTGRPSSPSSGPTS